MSEEEFFVVPNFKWQLDFDLIEVLQLLYIVNFKGCILKKSFIFCEVPENKNYK